MQQWRSLATNNNRWTTSQVQRHFSTGLPEFLKNEELKKEDSRNETRNEGFNSSDDPDEDMSVPYEHKAYTAAEEASYVDDPLAKGKIVHPPGAKREMIRSEIYGMKIYLEEGPRDHLRDDGNYQTSI